MKNTFNRFAIRFLEVLLLGLAMLAFRSGSGPLGILTPQTPSPWELSKLEFWPMLAAVALTGPFCGGVAKALKNAGAWLTAGPLALCLLFWGISRLHPAGGVYLILWMALSAVIAALCNQERTWKHEGVWLFLTAVLAAAYILFTFLPPAFGPFLDGAAAAVMATIPC